MTGPRKRTLWLVSYAAVVASTGWGDGEFFAGIPAKAARSEELLRLRSTENTRAEARSTRFSQRAARADPGRSRSVETTCRQGGLANRIARVPIKNLPASPPIGERRRHRHRKCPHPRRSGRSLTREMPRSATRWLAVGARRSMSSGGRRCKILRPMRVCTRRGSPREAGTDEPGSLPERIVPSGQGSGNDDLTARRSATGACATYGVAPLAAG